MGYWGEFVVVRSERSARQLDPLSHGFCRRGHYDECIGLERERDDAWQIVAVRHGLPGATEETVRRLAEQTGAPALICYVFDSDTGLLHGWSQAGGPWRTWFRPQFAAEYEVAADISYEDETGMPSSTYQAAWDVELDRIVRDMPEHTRQLAAWATHAGWTPDPDAVYRALMRDDRGFAEEQFGELLDALGAPAYRPLFANNGRGAR